MYDPALIAELDDRLGPGVAHIEPQTGEGLYAQTEEVVNAIFQTWSILTFNLLMIGFAPRDLCDSVNTASSIKEKVNSTKRERV